MLKDLKVIELAGVLAGPAAGMFFAELGAEVIKIENSKTGGDITRKWKLPSEDFNKNTSAYFASVNYNKQHLFLNLHDNTDLQKLYAHIRTADVLISNWKKGDAEKLKVSYEIIKEINPQIIYAQITGYGDHSPRVAYDVVLQAETGWMFMNGTKESGPVKIPVAVIDLFAAHQLKEGILIALLNRTKTNKGAKVTVSLFDAAIASLANQASNFLMENYIPQRSGSLHPNIAPYGEIMHTKDGKQIILAVGTDKQFEVLCDLLQLHNLVEDVNYKTNLQRLMHRSNLAKMLQEKILMFNADDLLTIFQEKNIAAGLIRSMEELFQLDEAKELILEDEIGSRVRSAIFKIES
ncbi:MAG: CoA transferase [Fimbriimonadaceae bacterium]|nr:CoA transferase [Chitinophagales bacterium]